MISGIELGATLQDAREHLHKDGTKVRVLVVSKSYALLKPNDCVGIEKVRDPNDNRLVNVRFIQSDPADLWRE